MTLGEIVILLMLVVGYIIFSLIKKSPEHILDRNLEKYRDELNRNMEELKKDLTLEISDIEARDEQKRVVYTNLVTSMSVFIGGRVSSPDSYRQYIENFYNSYDTAWLWASDEVMKSMSDYMQFKIENNVIQQQNLQKISILHKDALEAQEAQKTLKELDAKEKELFLECIFMMRKDVFNNTNLSKEDYKFITF